MVKVAYNACYGGFALSREAVLRAREITGDPKWGGACIAGDVYDDGSGECERDYGFLDDVERTDPALIQVIEELGEAANSEMATQLKIKDIPAGTKYRIDEYGGLERVMTVDDYVWETA